MPNKTEPGSEGDDTLAWDSTRTSFTQIPDWILFHTDVNDAALRTWLAIASYVDNKSRGAFPKVSTLAAKRGKGRRQIFDHLDQLEAAGLLERRAQFRPDGRRKHNHYTLAWKQPLRPVTRSGNNPSPDTAAENQGIATESRGAENRTALPRQEPCAENRTGADAEIRSGDYAENRAAGTTPTKELDPLTPSSEDTQPPILRGTPAPLTPRQKSRGMAKRGSRSEGTNPRAIRSIEAQQTTRHTQMVSWARTMNIPSISLDDFEGLVDGEVRSGRICEADGEVALTEARSLRQNC